METGEVLAITEGDCTYVNRDGMAVCKEHGHEVGPWCEVAPTHVCDMGPTHEDECKHCGRSLVTICK